MGVYIPYMKMPKNCVFCNVQKGCQAQSLMSKNRPDHCPLTEIPTPHGKLIDADTLCTDLTRFYKNEVTAKELIHEQSTIIEAEDK